MDQHIAESGVNNPVTADHINSKRYFIKEIKPEDYEGRIGDVCFVISEEKIVPPEPPLVPGMVLVAHYDFVVGDWKYPEIRFPGIFSTEFQNYVIHINIPDSSSSGAWRFSLLDETDEPDGSVDYTFQELRADNSAVTGGRTTKSFWTLGESQQGHMTLYVYGPATPGATAVRSLSLNGSPLISDNAGTKPDGVFTGLQMWISGGAKVPGKFSVYGVRS